MKIVEVSESAFTVQGHGVHTAFVETVSGLRSYADIEVMVNSIARADIRHIHTVGLYSLVHLLILPGKKVVSAHVVPASFVGSLKGAQRWLPLATRYLRWFYNRADVVIAVSDATQTELRSLGVKKPIYVVYNMIDTSRYVSSVSDRAQARQALGIPDSSWVVVSNGQVQPRKRIDSFIACARALPSIKFIWIGGIPFKNVAAEYGAMKQIIDTAPQNVTFTGVIPLGDVKTYFHAGDVFMLPSEQETFGLAVIEAAASGLPIILRDIHDYDATFRPDAIFCKDDNGFVETITSLQTDRALYSTMTAAASRIALRYDAKTITTQLVGLFRSLTK